MTYRIYIKYSDTYPSNNDTSISTSKHTSQQASKQASKGRGIVAGVDKWHIIIGLITFQHIISKVVLSLTSHHMQARKKPSKPE